VILVAKEAPAAAAPISRNLRHESLLAMIFLRFRVFAPVTRSLGVDSHSSAH